ncbi:hypothetical protein SBOR_5283 [Sclerotinia borealis F-4128]|uniref:2EXR domain-containing protein n=1 Tax=Sclerotinia borealis (strain F-4128) TaxID=1432307 RepID=W9CI47_SCLBF|nr:hypothetical protein SBOR_5283 [Sclerotinia borealis F-4128]
MADSNESTLVAPHNMVPDKTYDSFPLFSKLPTEVRLLIWKMVIPDPRIIQLEAHSISRCEHAMVRVRSDMVVPDKCQNDDYDGSDGTICTGIHGMIPQDLGSLDAVRARLEDDDQFGFTSAAVPPPLLTVCRESHDVAIKNYTRAFPSVGAFAETYFDYERDVLYLSATYIQYEVAHVGDCHVMARSEACKVQNLAIRMSFQVEFPGNFIIPMLLRLFCNVKSLTILIEDCQTDVYENGMTQEQRRSELVLFEPIEIGQALLMFEAAETQFSDIYKGLLCESEERDSLDVDMGYLERKRLEDIKKGSVWNLPKIQWKILTTATFKTNFEQLQNDYELLTGVKCYRIHDTHKFTIDPKQLLLEP